MSTRDFKAKNIRSTNIIASGSQVPAEPSILIYSASAATNTAGGRHADLLTKVGTDVFLFVSGTKLVDSNGTPTFSKNSSDRVDTTVFGGDVVISGTMYAENILGEVDLTTTGSLTVEGPLFVTGSSQFGNGISSGDAKVSIRTELNDVPDKALRIDHNDTNDNALYIDAASTSATVALIEANALTTGKGLSVFTDSGNLNNAVLVDVDNASDDPTDPQTALRVRTSSTNNADDSDANIGLDIDFNPAGGSASRALRIDSEQTTGIVAEIKADARTTGTALSISDNATNDNAGSLVKIAQTGDRAGSANSTGLEIDFNTTANTNARALKIDSEQTTGVVAEIDGNAITTGAVLIVSGTQTQHAGEIFKVVGRGERTLVEYSQTAANTSIPQVRFLSSSAVPNKDVSFFVSGSTGDIGLHKGGLSLFAGDVVISGSLMDGSGSPIVGSSSETSGSFNEVIVSGETPSFVTTASLSIAGGLGFQHDVHEVGTDVYFFVSGTIGETASGATGGKKAVFGGDTVVSGGLHVSSSNHLTTVLIETAGDNGGSSPMIELKSTKTAGSSADAAIQLSTPNGMTYIDAGYNGANSGVKIDAGSRGVDFNVKGSNAMFDVTVQTGNAASSINMRTDDGGIKFDLRKSSGKKVHFDVESTDDDSIHLDTQGGVSIEALKTVAIGSTAGSDGPGDDVRFFVSGTKAATGASQPHVAAFGGDLVTSGNVKMLNLNQPVTGAHLVLSNDQATIAGEGGAVRVEMGVGINESAFEGSKFQIQKNNALTPAAQGGPHSVTFLNLSGSIGLMAGNSRDLHPTNGYTGQFGVMATDAFGNSLFGGKGAKPLGNAIVQILSGGAGTSYDEAGGGDVAFYVSGSRGDRGNAAKKGTSVFGGDVVVSGNIHTAEYIYHEGDSDTHIRLQPDRFEVFVGNAEMLDLVEDGAQDKFQVNPAAADIDFVVAAVENTGIITVDALLEQVKIDGSEDGSSSANLFEVQNSMGNVLDISQTGGVVFNEGGSSAIDFRVESFNKSNAIFVDASADQVSFLSSSAVPSGIKFFVSGSTGGGNGAGNGTVDSVFGGDLAISGGLQVRGGLESPIGYTVADIGKGSSNVGQFVVNPDNGNVDFRVGTDTKTHAVFVMASHNKVYFLEDDAPSNTHNLDTNFFVSGAIGNKDSSTRSIATFGGDVAISGSTHALGTLIAPVGLSGSLTQLSDGTSYIKAGSNVTIVSASNGAITISSTGGGGGSAVSNVGWLAPANNTITTTGSILVGTANTSNADITLGSDGSAVFNDQSAAVDFRVESNNREHAIFVDGSTDQVFILSGSTSDKNSVPESGYTDLAFFVSGSIGDRGTSKRGTSVFGGDAVVSGSLIVNPGKSNVVTNVFNNRAGSAVFKVNSAGVIFNEAGDTNNDFRVESNSNAHMLFVDSSTNRLGIGKTGATPATTVHVKDSTPVVRIQRDANTELSSLDFAGQSGAIAVQLANTAGNNDFVISTHDGSGVDEMLRIGSHSGALNRQIILLSGSDMHVGAMQPKEAGDIAFFVSGAIGKTGSDEKGTAVFGGDAVVSGNIHVGQYIYHSGDTDSNTFIQFAEDSIGLTAGGEQLITISEAGQDIVKIGDGGDVDFQVRTNGDDNTLYVQGSSDRVGIGTDSPGSLLHLKESAPTLSIQRESNANDSTLAFLGSGGNTGAIVHQSTSNDLVFKTHDGSSPHEIMRLGGHYGSDNRQIILLSGSAMAASAMQPKEAGDINFFVSGAIGKRGSDEKGTAVFGGDMFVSGAIHTEQPFSIVHNSTTTDALLITATENGADAAPIITLKRNSASPANSDAIGQLKFKGENDADEELVYAKITGKIGDKADGAEDGVIEFTTKNAGSNAIIARIKNTGLDVLGAISGSTIETGLLFSDSGDLTIQNQASDKDIVFKVNKSGLGSTTMLTMDADLPLVQTPDGIKQAFGGPNNFISGSITPGKGLGLAIKSNRCIWISGSQGVFFGKRTGTGNQDEGNDVGVPSSIGKDTAFFVSGTLDSRGTSDRGTAVFGGDVVISGTLHGGSPLKIAGGIELVDFDSGITSNLKSTALSGSLTNLADGTSYLKAGNNVTITTGSNGAVTIASTAVGGGGGAGSEGWIAPANNNIVTTGSILVGTANTSNADITLGSDGSAIFNGQSAQVDFRVKSDTKTNIIYVNGENDFVELGGGGQAFGSQDVSVHLSGTIGRTNDPGNDQTASAVLVSSDLVVSGAIFGGEPSHGDGRELVLASKVITCGSTRGEEFGEDVSFFVSGSTAFPNSAEQKTNVGVTLFGGSVVLSGSVIPGLDSAVDLGAPNNRFRNIYTGDLHLRNDRGDWTIVEERDYLCVVNNITGKKFKMNLTPIED